MVEIDTQIKEKFFDFIGDSCSISEFENWVYNSGRLNNCLSNDDYLELISLNYKRKSVKYDVIKILKKYINLGEYQNLRLKKLLIESKKMDENLPYLLMEFYDWYCRGCSFLVDLGLGYGLTIECPPTNIYSAESWDDLSPEEKTQLLGTLSPGLEEEIDRVLDWIDSKKIIFLENEENDYNYKYIDNRTDEEKKSRLWVEVGNNKKGGASVSKNLLWEKSKPKKWWKIWRHA